MISNTPSKLVAFGLLLATCTLIAPMPAQGRRRSQLRPPVQFTKNHESVRNAFKPVVAAARRATVSVYSDGKSVGFGAVVGSNGQILTHATGVSGEITCKLADGRDLPAKIVARDVREHIVLLQVKAKGLPVLEWAGRSPEPGSWVATTSTKAMPLAIGVMSVELHSRTQNYGFLGVRFAQNTNDVRLQEVIPDTGAARAGLKIGDTIMKFAGRQVRSIQQIQSILRRKKPGARIDMVVKRGSDEMSLTATLGQRASNGDRTGPRNRQEPIWGPLSKVRLGFSEVLQHDTVLRPDQCGGPIVNTDGKAVGLNISRVGRIETIALTPKAVRTALAKMRGKKAPTKPKPTKRAWR